MNLFDNIMEHLPMRAVVGHLKESVDRTSGIEGAAYGAALGVFTAMATAKAGAKKLTVPTVLAGAALGVAYGVVDKRLIRHE